MDNFARFLKLGLCLNCGHGIIMTSTLNERHATMYDTTTASHQGFNETGLIIANIIIGALENVGIYARVQSTYLDYGQNMTWDTVIVYKNGPNSFSTDSYQAINPRQHDDMNNGKFTVADYNEILATAEKLTR